MVSPPGLAIYFIYKALQENTKAKTKSNVKPNLSLFQHSSIPFRPKFPSRIKYGIIYNLHPWKLRKIRKNWWLEDVGCKMYVSFRMLPFQGPNSFIFEGVGGYIDRHRPRWTSRSLVGLTWDTPTVWSSASTDHRKLHTDSGQTKMMTGCKISNKPIEDVYQLYSTVISYATMVIIQQLSSLLLKASFCLMRKSAALVGTELWNPNRITTKNPVIFDHLRKHLDTIGMCYWGNTNSLKYDSYDS